MMYICVFLIILRYVKEMKNYFEHYLASAFAK